MLFLTNNGILRLRKKLLLWIGCVLGNDSGVPSVPKFSAHGLFTKIFIAHRALYLVFPVQWMEKTHLFKSPLSGGSSSTGGVPVSGKTMSAQGPAPRGKPDLASS